MFFSEQLWKLTSSGKLKCKYYDDLYSRNALRNVSIPAEGTVGYIETYYKVLGVLNQSTAAGARVVLESKHNPISEGQKWYKTTIDSDGWFTLTNPNSAKNLNEVPNDIGIGKDVQGK